MTRGRFIVVEGVDGAGTTTHAKLLSSRLKEAGRPAHLTREPSDGPIGTLIRQVLLGRVGVPGPEGLVAPSWATMALLFAADRKDHLEAEIGPHLGRGTWVVSDRYAHSSIAYQTCTATGEAGAADWVRDINRYAIAPDLTIVLDVPADVAAARRRARTGPRELYDDDALQARLVEFYREIEAHFPGQRVVHVDGDRDRDAVAEDVLAAAVSAGEVP